MSPWVIFGVVKGDLRRSVEAPHDRVGRERFHNSKPCNSKTF